MLSNGSTAIEGWSGSGRARAPCRRRILGRADGLADEPVAAPVQRLDVARPARIVRERAAQLLDAGDERRVADRGLGPHRGEQLILGDHLAGPLGEEGQQRERLGREPDLARAGHQSAARVETIASEGKCPIRHVFLRRRG